MADLRDKLWLWGIVPNMLNKHFGFESRMTPAEGALYMGIRNIFMIVNANQPEPPFDQWTRALTTFNEVKWSIVGDCATTRTNEPYGDLDEVLRQAELFDNVTGGVLDDFFSHKTRSQVFTPDTIKYIQDTMHGFRKRPLDLWCVYYAGDNNLPQHLKYVDGAHMWTWNSADLVDFPKRFEQFKADTEGKKRMLGIYMLDYGTVDFATRGEVPTGKQMPVERMKYQLETYTDLLVKGDIDGIIFCANTAMDLNLPAVEFAKKWIEDNHNI